MYLLDTNICIYFMKNTYPRLTEKIFSYDPSQLAISSITVYELEYGASKSKWGEQTRQNLRMVLAPFNILPFDSNDAFMAGKIRAQLERKGTPIGPYDIQIAAQGLARDLIVVTHNTDEFRQVADLAVEDWKKKKKKTRTAMMNYPRRAYQEDEIIFCTLFFRRRLGCWIMIFQCDFVIPSSCLSGSFIKPTLNNSGSPR